MNMDNDLWKEFQSIGINFDEFQVGTDQFKGTKIDSANVILAKDSEARPLVLIPVSDTHKEPTLKLRNLSGQGAIECSIKVDGVATNGYFYMIRCLSLEVEVQRYFLDLIGSQIPAFDAPKAKEVRDHLLVLAELFINLGNPGTGTALGLWAEMFFISKCANPCEVIRRWHETNNCKFDFAEGFDYIEVKASRSDSRKHHFSSDQCLLDENERCIVVSILTKPRASGVSLADLKLHLLGVTESDAELELKIERICAEVLGRDYHDAMQIRFDPELAETSFFYCWITEVPHISSEHIPANVSDLRFCSNLEACEQLCISNLDETSQSIYHWL